VFEIDHPSVYIGIVLHKVMKKVSIYVTTEDLLPEMWTFGTIRSGVACAAALLGGIVLPGCDRSSDPVEEYQFLGITQTDQTGAVIGSPDSDDWCLSSVGPGNVPNEHALWPAYANPAITNCTITFGVSQTDSVDLFIVRWPNVKVRQIANGPYGPGTYALTWDLRDEKGVRLAPDIYRCIMKTADFTCHGDIQIIAP
jgi:hypothetical protein